MDGVGWVLVGWQCGGDRAGLAAAQPDMQRSYQISNRFSLTSPPSPPSHPFTSTHLCPPPQGIVKPALQRLRDAYSTKARDLADQLLSLQEQHDSMRELLAEREEENRNAEAQVGAGGWMGGCGGWVVGRAGVC